MAVTRYSDVIAAVVGDTVAGPLQIHSIKAVAAAQTGNITITSVGSSVKLYDSGAIAANAALYADEVEMYVPQGDSITIGGSATGGTLYIYLD